MESNTRTDRMWNNAIGALGKLKQAQGALEHIIERASDEVHNRDRSSRAV